MDAWTLRLAATAAVVAGCSAVCGGGMVDVTSTGARPDDGKDGTKAVRAAVGRCREQPGSTP